MMRVAITVAMAAMAASKSSDGDEMMIVEVMVVMIVKLVALVNNVVLVGMLIVILGYLTARSCKKILPAAAGRKPAGSRTAVETFLTRTKVGRKKPYANRIREWFMLVAIVMIMA